MDSPLFNIISKSKEFENNYTIFISQKFIDRYKLKDDYEIYFDNLNKLNIKYSSIYFVFEDKKKISYLKDFNIDFNKIRKINLIQDDVIEEEENENDKENNNKIFFETFFSFNNFGNNLIYHIPGDMALLIL